MVVELWCSNNAVGDHKHITSSSFGEIVLSVEKDDLTAPEPTPSIMCSTLPEERRALNVTSLPPQILPRRDFPPSYCLAIPVIGLGDVKGVGKYCGLWLFGKAWLRFIVRRA